MNQSELGNIQSITDEMALLFARDEPKRAEIARYLYAAAAEQPAQISRVYCSSDWWGGSGSMADFVPYDPLVRRRYLQLLVALVHTFEKASISCPRAQSWAEIFKQWLDAGVV
jgi:hypothetical protein